MPTGPGASREEVLAQLRAKRAARKAARAQQPPAQPNAPSPPGSYQGPAQAKPHPMELLGRKAPQFAKSSPQVAQQALSHMTHAERVQAMRVAQAPPPPSGAYQPRATPHHQKIVLGSIQDQIRMHNALVKTPPPAGPQQPPPPSLAERPYVAPGGVAERRPTPPGSTAERIAQHNRIAAMAKSNSPPAQSNSPTMPGNMPYGYSSTGFQKQPYSRAPPGQPAPPAGPPPAAAFGGGRPPPHGPNVLQPPPPASAPPIPAGDRVAALTEIRRRRAERKAARQAHLDALPIDSQDGAPPPPPGAPPVGGTTGATNDEDFWAGATFSKEKKDEFGNPLPTDGDAPPPAKDPKDVAKEVTVVFNPKPGGIPINNAIDPSTLGDAGKDKNFTLPGHMKMAKHGTSGRMQGPGGRHRLWDLMEESEYETDTDESEEGEIVTAEASDAKSDGEGDEEKGADEEKYSPPGGKKKAVVSASDSDSPGDFATTEGFLKCLGGAPASKDAPKSQDARDLPPVPPDAGDDADDEDDSPKRRNKKSPKFVPRPQVEVTFQPRRLGLVEEKGRVLKVHKETQAMSLNVQTGWQVARVNDEKVKPSQARERLKDAIAGGVEFTVVFDTKPKKKKLRKVVKAGAKTEDGLDGERNQRTDTGGLFLQGSHQKIQDTIKDRGGKARGFIDRTPEWLNKVDVTAEANKVKLLEECDKWDVGDVCEVKGAYGWKVAKIFKSFDDPLEESFLPDIYDLHADDGAKLFRIHARHIRKVGEKVDRQLGDRGEALKAKIKAWEAKNPDRGRRRGRGRGGRREMRNAPPTSVDDWECPQCGFNNFASRFQCRKCRGQKPREGEERPTNGRGRGRGGRGRGRGRRGADGVVDLADSPKAKSDEGSGGGEKNDETYTPPWLRSRGGGKGGGKGGRGDAPDIYEPPGKPRRSKKELLAEKKARGKKIRELS